MSHDIFDFKGYRELAYLERIGALRLLVILLIEGPIHISRLIRRSALDKGIATQQALQKTRIKLIEINLIEEDEEIVELTGSRRTYLRLTRKGEKVAKAVEKLGEVLWGHYDLET